MGYVILFVVLGLIGFALYSWYMNSTSIDDRDDSWWIFGRKSGPFYWRKRWMGKNDDTIADLYDDKIKRGLEDAKAGRVSQKDWKGNIRVKQKQDDWDDIKGNRNPQHEAVQLAAVILRFIINLT